MIFDIPVENKNQVIRLRYLRMENVIKDIHNEIYKRYREAK